MLAFAILDVITSAFLLKFLASFFMAKLVRNSCSRNFLNEPLTSDGICCTSSQNQKRCICNKNSAIKQHFIQKFNNTTSIFFHRVPSIDFEIPVLFLHELLSHTEPNPKLPQAAVVSSPFVSSIAPHEFNETTAKYYLNIDAPGFARGDLSITVVDDLRQLKITGKNSTRKPIDMVLAIPRLGNMEKIEASVMDGVLTVVIPKREHDGRIVEILAGHQDQARASSFSRSVPESSSFNKGKKETENDADEGFQVVV
ncbi:hypothetical protein HK100_008969 [Physocladia obscura]|uniref:SHSP domain-containing protein n=1 Tax=Physocladia obscura TaxID=109957 RepID=A0AAD5XEE6_9FUNG|nr:hypothetical protein HK100_008969 [Physocladia obscura]